MTVSELAEKLNLTILSGHNGLQRQITWGYTSDLLSDVIGNAQEGHVWITLQTHKNIMAVATLKELAAIVLVKGLLPATDTAEQSNKEEIPILGTNLETFEIVGKIHSLLTTK